MIFFQALLCVLAGESLHAPMLPWADPADRADAYQTPSRRLACDASPGAYACSAAGVDRQLKEGCGSRLAESSLKAVGPGHWDKVDETYAIQSPQGVPQGDRFSVSGNAA